MSEKEDLITKIIEIEWEMFSKVKNRGGKASCQEEPKTFEIIRSSNFMSWSEATLESYLNDLQGAKKIKRNLMTEKYARMEGLIPPPDSEVLSLIDKIVAIECKWLEELAAKSPQYMPARPVYSRQDTPGAVSSETYSRGELATYSKKTLDLYHQDILDAKQKNINRIETIFSRMLKEFDNNFAEEKG